MSQTKWTLTTSLELPHSDPKLLIHPELQEKMGPCSREVTFLGYPPGVKAYCCRDNAMGAFFNSRDVIFDESFASHPFPFNDSDNEDKPAPAAPAIPPAPIATSPPATQHSGHALNQTEHGKMYHDCLAADQARLAQQRDLHMACVQGVPSTDGTPHLIPTIPIATMPLPLPAPALPPPVPA